MIYSKHGCDWNEVLTWLFTTTVNTTTTTKITAWYIQTGSKILCRLHRWVVSCWDRRVLLNISNVQCMMNEVVASSQRVWADKIKYRKTTFYLAHIVWSESSSQVEMTALKHIPTHLPCHHPPNEMFNDISPSFSKFIHSFIHSFILIAWWSDFILELHLSLLNPSTNQLLYIELKNFQWTFSITATLW